MANSPRQRKQLHAGELVCFILLILAILARIAVEVIAFVFPQIFPVFVVLISDITIYALWTLTIFLSILK